MRITAQEDNKKKGRPDIQHKLSSQPKEEYETIMLSLRHQILRSLMHQSCTGAMHFSFFGELRALHF